MIDFDWTQFTRKMAINAPLKNLYDAWTRSEELERWFLSKALYQDADGNKIDGKTNCEAGNTYEWNWFLWNTTEKGKVIQANGTDNFQFTFAGDCLVEVSFAPFEDGTIVTVTQSNIPTDDASKQNIRLGCDSGWSFYLVNLKSIYEGGLDLRNKNPRLKPMLNN